MAGERRELLDWRLFDSATLSRRFNGDRYVERLKGLRPSPDEVRRKA